eukprot:CAMPEP_0185036806 /NCGR_PEP_ID=MMETSP1103-20130426/30287_1 /TAXON_ID=36769 /ORGANISM="Paraphysomonas bandaiensis, Strain Caron Lab Isolate" /LENGTH=457 /DNA_ID=CAMNT_0027574487 /DNA_START=297 /DNA_END=1671 /DNA_ORIENTATION=-
MALSFNESVAGIVSATWAPDSRHIIVESDFGIQLAVWSLIENVSYIINSPKPGSGNYSFSDCGRYFAVGHRLECKDHIGVYSTGPWSELNKFRSRSTDMAGVQWTPAGTHILVQDTHLTYRVLVYTPSGEVLAQYEAYQNALGVRTLSFYRPYSCPASTDCDEPLPCPSPLLAIGSYDGQVRLLSTHSWKLAFVLPTSHPGDMPESMAGRTVCTVEVIDSGAGEGGDTASSMSFSSELSTVSAKRTKEQAGVLGNAYITRNLKALPKLAQSTQLPKNDMLPPKFGVSWLGWSACGTLLAVREDSHPRCLWIWHALEARLCDLLVQLDTIVCARWRPDSDGLSGERTPLLAFCCNTPRVYFWTPMGSSWADLPPISNKQQTPSVPAAKPRGLRGGAATLAASAPPDTTTELNVQGLRWSTDGKRLLLIGKDRFCSCDVTLDASTNEVDVSHEAEDVSA